MSERTDILTKPKQKLTRAPRYRVILLNDDFTPMDFVVWVLIRFFHKSPTDASRIMFEVHENGLGLCGIYTLEIAETKTQQVMQAASDSGHPLRCILEPEAS